MKMRAMLSLLTALSLPAVAEVLADPTQPPAEWQAAPQHGLAESGRPRLTSILISPSRRVAVIDGISLREGQSANGLTVVHIGKSWVDARVRDTSVRLSLSDANVTKEPR
jgi:MSHA biogenesis protein MshK